MKFKKRPAIAPEGCVYRWVEGWGWGLFSRRRPIPLWRRFKDGCRQPLDFWMGLTAPPPRIGIAAPKRWANQAVGIPPFVYRLVFEAIGQRLVCEAEITEAKELFRRRNAIHRANKEPEPNLDNLCYSEPRNTHTASEWPPKYASGIYALEMRDARDKAFSRGVFKHPVAADAYGRAYTAGNGFKADTDNGAATALGPIQQGAKPIAREEWSKGGYSIERIPKELMLSREDRELCARILQKSPGRKPGRPPIGEQAMTNAERVAKHRAKKSSLALPPQEREQPDIAPPPQRSMSGNHLESLMTKQFLEQLYDRLGDVLDRLATAPPDYIVMPDDIRTLIVAAALHRAQLN